MCRLPPIASRRVRPAFAPVLLLTCLVAACDGGGVQVGDGHDHSHGAAAEFDQGDWPPRLSGIEDVQPLAPSARARTRARARASVIEAARGAVMNNPALRVALGDEFAEFEATLADAKSPAVANFLFYAYGRDMTVEASLMDDGTVSIESHEAASLQPPENRDEVSAAIALGRASLADAGFDTGDLEGTAMLAFPGNVSSVAGTPHFHDQRILYVTFGQGDGELPLYSALVNLSTDQVSDGGPIR